MRFLGILLRGVFLPRSLERFLSYYRCIWVSCSAVHFYFNILLFENHTIVYMKNHLRILKQIALGLLFTLAFIARANAQACSTSNEVTITVVNDPSISITGASTICSGGTATLTATPAGGTGTCTIQWQSSPNGTTGWADIVGANGTTYAPTSLTATTYYRATYSCTGLACDAATSNTQTLTVNPDLAIQTQPTPIIECVGGTTSMTVTATGTTGTGTLSYVWEQSTSTTGPWAAASGGTNSPT